MNHIFVRFCVLQGAYWSFYAVLPAYITAYMLECGMSASLLGIVIALFMFCSFLGSLFWGRWVDKRQANRRFFLLANLSAMLLGTLIYFFAGIPALLLVLYPLFGFMIGFIPTALDAWVIALFPNRGDAVAQSRVFATASYAVVMLAAGQLIARIGYWVMPVTALVFLAVNVTVAFLQPECAKADTEVPVSDKPQSQVSPKKLLSSRRYVLLVAMVFVTGIAIAPINNMKVVVFESVGGDVSFLGWDAFIGCIVQIPFLVLVQKMRHVRSEYRLIIGAAAALLYTIIVVVAKAPAYIIVGTCLTNVSFGILFPTMRQITEESVTPTLRNTAHSIIDVAYGSLSGMIASAWGGVVLEAAGTVVLGTICSGIALAAVGISLLMLRTGKGAARLPH